MSEPVPILVARSYAEMVDGIAMRIAGLQVDHLSLDAACGLADGHTGKLMAFTKGYGDKSLDAHLEALGLCLVVAIDPDRTPRITHSRDYRAPDASAVLASRLRTREGRELLGEVCRRNAKKGVRKIRAGMRDKLTPAHRRKNARIGARARWAAVRNLVRHAKPDITRVRVP